MAMVWRPHKQLGIPAESLIRPPKVASVFVSKSGHETVVTTNGESHVALITAEQFDDHRRYLGSVLPILERCLPRISEARARIGVPVEGIVRLRVERRSPCHCAAEIDRHSKRRMPLTSRYGECILLNLT